MDTPTTPPSPIIPEQANPPSLLDQIIQTSQESSLPGVIPPVPASSGDTIGSVPP